VEEVLKMLEEEAPHKTPPPPMEDRSAKGLKEKQNK